MNRILATLKFTLKFLFFLFLIGLIEQLLVHIAGQLGLDFYNKLYGLTLSILLVCPEGYRQLHMQCITNDLYRTYENLAAVQMMIIWIASIFSTFFIFDKVLKFGGGKRGLQK